MLSTLPSSTIALLIPTTVPVNFGLSLGALVAIKFRIVVDKFASLFNVSANLSNGFSAGGAESTRLAILASTSILVYVVVSSAFRSRAVCVAVDIGLSESEGLSTLPS